METKLNINAIPDGSIGKDKFTEEVSNILDSVNNKQETLVSSVNIKTIKGKDVLGEGNIEFEENVEAVDTAETIEELDKTPNLKYTTQILTEEEKTVARSNIDSLSPKDLKTVNGYTLVGTGNIILSDEIGKINSIDIDSTENGVDININNSLLATIPNATTENSGVMSPGDKSTIDNINAAIEEGEKRVLRKLFIAAGALYNDANVPVTRRAPWGEDVKHLSGHYYLNGLGDITEEQMTEIYNAGTIKGGDINYFYMGYNNIRTNLPRPSAINYGGYSPANCLSLFRSASNVECVCLTNGNRIYASAIPYAFYHCEKMKVIVDVIDLTGTKASYHLDSGFTGCISLEIVKLAALKYPVSFADSPLLNKASILYTIQNASPTTAITITLHADAYARLESDADIVAALEAQPLITLVSA